MKDIYNRKDIPSIDTMNKILDFATKIRRGGKSGSKVHTKIITIPKDWDDWKGEQNVIIYNCGDYLRIERVGVKR